MKLNFQILLAHKFFFTQKNIQVTKQFNSKVISILLSHRKTVITPHPLIENSPKADQRNTIHLYHVAKFQLQLTSKKCSKSRSKLFDDVKIKFWLFHEPSRDMKISFSKPPWWVDTFWGQNFVSTMCSSKVMAKNVFATFGNRKMSTRKMTTLELELRDFFPGSNRCFSISRCLQLIEN